MKRVTRADRRRLSDLIMSEAMERFDVSFDDLLDECRAAEFLNRRGWMARVAHQCGLSISGSAVVFDSTDFKTASRSIARANRAFPNEDWESYAKKVEGIYRANYHGTWPFSDRDSLQKER